MNCFPDVRRTSFQIVIALTLLGSWAGCATSGDSSDEVAGTHAPAAGEDTSSAVSPATHEKKETPLVISHGQEVTLEDYLVTGKTTIFEFTSRFDAHCRAMSKRLDRLHAKREDIAVVRVDINRPEIKGPDWSSPVCQQYQVHSLPVFKIYDASGKLTAEDKKAESMADRWAGH